MKFSRWGNTLTVIVMLELLAVGVSFGLPYIKFGNQTVVPKIRASQVQKVFQPVYVPPQKLSNPPEIIKAVYVTGYSAGSRKYLNYLTNLFKTTEINAVVVDIKDYSGKISYNSGAADVKKYNLYDNAIPDIDSLVRFFHDQNIYVVGRIVVFEDPAYSKSRPDLAVYNKTETTDLKQPVLWQDNNGLSWLDPASKEVWDYDISLAKDALYHGFDEINFDYIRFPSDGKVENMGFPVWDEKIAKAVVIKSFFQYIRTSLPGEKISADLFGQTTTNTDDMGIGQIIENAFENFDYVSPMVYPSHYANGFLGFDNPAEHPYEIIKYSMLSAIIREKNLFDQEQSVDVTAVTSPATQPVMAPPPIATISLAKLRPWLQDFNMGAVYTADMVQSEIKAVQDALGDDFSGFMMWNPSNIYTEDAVKLENPTPNQ